MQDRFQEVSDVKRTGFTGPQVYDASGGLYHNKSIAVSHFETFIRPSSMFVSRSPRFDAALDTTAGPGEYDPRITALDVRDPAKPLSVFASKVPRAKPSKADESRPPEFDFEKERARHWGAPATSFSKSPRFDPPAARKYRPTPSGSASRTGVPPLALEDLGPSAKNPSRTKPLVIPGRKPQGKIMSSVLRDQQLPPLDLSFGGISDVGGVEAAAVGQYERMVGPLAKPTPASTPRSGRSPRMFGPGPVGSPERASPRRRKAHQPFTAMTVTAVRLSNNELRLLEGLPMALAPVLGHNVSALQWLDLSFNKMSTVDFAVLANFSSLTLLNLHANRISTFENLRHGRYMTQLKSLTIHGNPISKKPGIRTKLINAFPALQKLDGQVVTPQERHMCEHAVATAKDRKARLATARVGFGFGSAPMSVREPSRGNAARAMGAKKGAPSPGAPSASTSSRPVPPGRPGGLRAGSAPRRRSPRKVSISTSK